MNKYGEFTTAVPCLNVDEIYFLWLRASSCKLRFCPGLWILTHEWFVWIGFPRKLNPTRIVKSFPENEDAWISPETESNTNGEKFPGK